MRRFGNSRRIILAGSVSALALGASGLLTAAWAADDKTNADSTTVGEVVVTGQRAALKSAQQIKKDSEQIVDSITAVDIGALPDRSVTEALQRISGVTITRTPDPRDADRISVEGSGVQVRGLSYVRSELNGRDSFSAKNGRALSFDDVPPELLVGVDVYKNPSADIVEGGLGGTVNLRTRVPFDQKGRLIAFSADYNYADLAKAWEPAGSVLFSDRWDTPIGELGLLVDLSDSKFESRTDTFSVDPYFARTNLVAGQTVFVPGGFGYRSLRFDRERQGIAGAVQWKPNAQWLVTGQFLRSAAYTKEYEHAVGLDPGASVFPAAGTSFTYDSHNLFTSGTLADSAGGSTIGASVIDDRYDEIHSVTSDYSLNVKFYPNEKWTFIADIQYIKAKTKQLDFTLFDLPTSPLPASTLDLRGGLPSATIPVSTAYASDPANYYWNAAMDYHNHNDADEWAESIEGAYTFDSDWLKSFRFGIRNTRREAVTRETPFNWGFISQSWTGAGLAKVDTSLVGSSAVYPFNNFFRGDIRVPFRPISGTDAFISNYGAAVQAILAAEKAPAWGGAWTPFNGDYSQFGAGSGGTNTQREETLAGFGLLRFAHDLTFGGNVLPMDGNVGVRVVQTKASGVGFAAFPANSGIVVPPFTAGDLAFSNGAQHTYGGGRNYVDVLPSLNLRFKLTPDLQLRFAVAKSIVRPDFSQMQPTLSVSPTLGYNGGSGCTTATPPPGQQNNCVYQYTAFAGNPALKPVRSDQFDLSLEWYFAPTGSVTATVFRKDIYNFITTTVTSTQITNNGVTRPVLVTQPYNAGHGVIQGFEFTYQQYYDQLPGLLKGLGVQANFTYVDSKGARNPSANPYDPTQIANAQNQTSLPLEGLSRTAYNVALLYDNGPVSARLAYNWREKHLLTTSAANINIPAWFNDYGQLDASFFYTISPKIKIGVEAANLTKSRSEILVSYPTTPNPGMTGHNWVQADRRIAIVLRGQF